MVGACHHSKDSAPPPPGRPAVVGAGAAAAGATAPGRVAIAAGVTAGEGGAAGAVVAAGWVGAAGPHAASSATAPTPDAPRLRNARRLNLSVISGPPLEQQGRWVRSAPRNRRTRWRAIHVRPRG